MSCAFYLWAKAPPAETINVAYQNQHLPNAEWMCYVLRHRRGLNSYTLLSILIFLKVKEQNIELDDLRGQLELSKEQLELYREQLEINMEKEQRSSRRKGIRRGEQRVEMLMMNQELILR